MDQEGKSVTCPEEKWIQLQYNFPKFLNLLHL